MTLPQKYMTWHSIYDKLSYDKLRMTHTDKCHNFVLFSYILKRTSRRESRYTTILIKELLDLKIAYISISECCKKIDPVFYTINPPLLL